MKWEFYKIIETTLSGSLQSENKSVCANSKTYASILLNETPMRPEEIKCKIKESEKNEVSNRQNVKTIGNSKGVLMVLVICLLKY